MQDQLLAWDVLLFDGRFDQLLGQIGAFAVCEHPPDHTATVDVQDDVKVIAW